MNQIMLRFRPIAPKPAGAGASFSDTADHQKRNGKRRKRKYVRVRKEKVKTTPSPPQKSADSEINRPSVTLQLLPERSETELAPPEEKVQVETASCMAMRSVAWIIVECVTEISTDSSNVKQLGFSDKDKIRGLETDTCPGFVSNGVNSVIWVNDAYKRMMVGSLVVRLVVKEMLPRFSPSFACRVTLIQHTVRGQKWNRIVPCDVWTMEEFPGFAWRLDVNTSIGLGF